MTKVLGKGTEKGTRKERERNAKGTRNEQKISPTSGLVICHAF